jgi:hypothetical protein
VVELALNAGDEVAQQHFGLSAVSLARYKREYQTLLLNQDEGLDHYRKMAKSRQKARDIARLERKAFRNTVRVENALEEYCKAIHGILTTYRLDNPRVRAELKKPRSGNRGIVHISDWHLNEIVHAAEGIDNVYDFEVAAKRAALFVAKAKGILRAYNVNEVLVAMTGDLLNSDRRIDELLNQATNRARATMLAFHLLEQVIYDLSDWPLTVASVAGNESRIGAERHHTELAASDNFDLMLHNLLAVAFRDVPTVNFVGGHCTELIVNFKGFNVLLLHGEPMGKNNQTMIQKIGGKYMFRGRRIDYVIYGHYHACHIGDLFARSSSLVGSNAYSDKELQLEGRASQNVYIVGENGEVDAIRFALQDTYGVEGYDLNAELLEYDAQEAKAGGPQVVEVEV